VIQTSNAEAERDKQLIQDEIKKNGKRKGENSRADIGHAM